MATNRVRACVLRCSAHVCTLHNEVIITTGGQLTEAVRRKPYSVVLFDEVEKAHEEVFNILLGVLDDGRLTDGKGRTVNFANTVIILTSNLGSHLLLAAAEGPEGATPQQMASARQAVMAVVHRHFRPEFLNRLDDCVMFHPLQPAQLRQVAALQVCVCMHDTTRTMRLQAQLVGDRLVGRNIKLQFTDAALDYVVQQSYDVRFGARPLRRWLEQQVVTRLSEMLISGELTDDSQVVVDVVQEELIYTVSKLASEPVPMDAATMQESDEFMPTVKPSRVQEPDD